MSDAITISLEHIQNSKLNQVDFNHLGFGKYFSDHMLEADYEDGEWKNVRIRPYQTLQFLPALCVLHYAQTIFEGLKAESQNRFPSLKFDVGAVNGLAGKVFSAGFYYKTFMGSGIGPLRSTKFWMLCEKLIRRAAGNASRRTDLA